MKIKLKFENPKFINLLNKVCDNKFHWENLLNCPTSCRGTLYQNEQNSKLFEVHLAWRGPKDKQQQPGGNLTSDIHL